MTTSRSKASYVKGRKRAPIWKFLINSFVLVGAVAFVFAPPYLARDLFGVAAPSRYQIKTARALICGVVMLPFVLGMAWMLWRRRNVQVRPIDRRPRAPLEDASKRVWVDK